MALIDRHFAAIGAPEIFEFQADDPGEVLLMKAAEATGKVAAARDIRERYRRAKGYVETDPQSRARRACARSLALTRTGRPTPISSRGARSIEMPDADLSLAILRGAAPPLAMPAKRGGK
jgi:hypothetical protein